LTTWRKSSHSGAGDDRSCVELTRLGPSIAIRDSKHPTTPPLFLTPAQWRTFTRTVKTSSYNR